MVYLYDNNNSATSMTHVIWVQSYEALHSAATIQKTSEMTY